jgi:SanA protein
MRIKKIAKVLGGIFVSLFVIAGGSSWYVLEIGRSYIVEAADASAPVSIVLGAGLTSNGTPSDILRDRLMVALALYDDGRTEKIVCSGDNGQVQYDEVNAMREWLLDHDVDADDIFLDHAGFDTYDSMVRAAKVFGITSAIVVTQDFHLPRALYIAQAEGIEVQGVSASLEPYRGESIFRLREIPARIKVFFEVLFHTSPKYLGDPVNILEDGRVTWDEGRE